MIEQWKDIPQYEGLYQVSNFGRIKSLSRKSCGRTLSERILKCSPGKNGYVVTRLYKCGVGKTFRVHRLVAESFVDNKEGFVEINHKDENKANNNADNLEWCSRSYNMTYGNCRAHNVSKVALISDTGKILKTFNSMKSAYQWASSELGIIGINISRVCKGEQATTKGLRWRYVNK